MENVKFKRCVISDVSYGCGLLTLTVNTKGFKRYSTGLKRVREVLENTFEEHSANMLLTELYRAEHNSFDDCNTVCRGGHSYYGGIVCKYVVDFYYSSAEHFKDDTYAKSVLCVFSVYLRGSTTLSDVLLSDGLLSGLFALEIPKLPETLYCICNKDCTIKEFETRKECFEYAYKNNLTGDFDDIWIEEKELKDPQYKYYETVDYETCDLDKVRSMLELDICDDTSEDTSDTSEDTSDTSEDTSDTSFMPLPNWFYQRANIDIWSAVLAAFNAVCCAGDRRKRVIVKPVRISSRQCFPVRISPYGMPADYYPYKMLVDGLEVWDCRSWVYNMYLADLTGAPPDNELPF